MLALSLALAGCSGGGSKPPPPIQPPISGWTQFFGSGASGTDFDFPAAPGSVQYVVEPGTVQLGQSIVMAFTISGTGTWGIKDPTDTLPPKITIILWERNDNLTGQGVYETYREYCAPRTEITNPGQYIVTCMVDPSHFTGVFGQPPDAASFQQLLNNLYAIGFTFGGNSFAGHGLFSATPTMHFSLQAFSIQ